MILQIFINPANPGSYTPKYYLLTNNYKYLGQPQSFLNRHGADGDDHRGGKEVVVSRVCFFLLNQDLLDLCRISRIIQYLII